MGENHILFVYIILYSTEALVVFYQGPTMPLEGKNKCPRQRFSTRASELEWAPIGFYFTLGIQINAFCVGKTGSKKNDLLVD